jgi:putative transposase
MPEHFHLLISEPDIGTPSTVLQVLKQRMAPRGAGHFWQKRFYDFNVFTAAKRIEKLNYMHENPVKRGLVESPQQWRWSSYRAYAFGEKGPVVLNAWPEARLTRKVEQT